MSDLRKVVALFIVGGLVILPLPYVVTRMSVGNDVQAWCERRNSVLPGAEGVSWELAPLYAGLTCVYSTAGGQAKVYHDMGSVITIAGVSAVTVGIALGVGSALFSRRRRGAPVEAGSDDF